MKFALISFIVYFLKCSSHIVFFNLSATPLYLILFDWVTHAVVEISIWGDNRIFTETSIKQWVKISSFMRAVKNKNSFIECSGNNFNALHITLPFKSFSGQGDVCLWFWILLKICLIFRSSEAFWKKKDCVKQQNFHWNLNKVVSKNLKLLEDCS